MAPEDLANLYEIHGLPPSPDREEIWAVLSNLFPDQIYPPVDISTNLPDALRLATWGREIAPQLLETFAQEIATAASPSHVLGALRNVEFRQNILDRAKPPRWTEEQQRMAAVIAWNELTPAQRQALITGHDNIRAGIANINRQPTTYHKLHETQMANPDFRSAFTCLTNMAAIILEATADLPDESENSLNSRYGNAIRAESDRLAAEADERDQLEKKKQEQLLRADRKYRKKTEVPTRPIDNNRSE